MNRHFLYAIGGLVLQLSGTDAIAACDVDTGSVRVIGNEFPAVRAMGDAMTDAVSGCDSEQLSIRVNLTSENKKLHIPALSVTPAEYTTSIVGNAAFMPLLNADLIQPLDPYIEKFGIILSDQQRVTIDGQTMAIAFMANAQHLFYRQDVLREAGVEVPTNYRELLDAAYLIQEKGLMRYPIGATYQAGWNLALEFINLYMATGSAFFEPGSPAPSINNPSGIETLTMMKSLSAYMHPDFLTHGPNEVQAEWSAGNIALSNLWGSRAAAVIDNKNALRDVIEHTAFAAAPAFGERQGLATSLWWVGFTLASNISDEDADATFIAMSQAMSSELVSEHREKAVWLMPGYKPTPSATGVFDVVNGKSESYPMASSMGLLHAAIGTGIVDFLQDKESAEQALKDIEDVYRTAAKEAGYLQ